jgi:hypothetical protein
LRGFRRKLVVIGGSASTPQVARSGLQERIFRMWNPKNQGDYFKSRITYEACHSEDVAKFVDHWQGYLRIICDPNP